MNARHLKALKHLPEVIEALEALGKEKDRLQRALGRAGVAPAGGPGLISPAAEALRRGIPLAALREADYEASVLAAAAAERLRAATSSPGVVPPPADQAAEEVTEGQARAERWVREHHGMLPPLPPLVSGTANLETPERREFEEARRAGKVVPMELSEKELERRAFLAQTRGERQGLLDQFAGAKSGSATPEEAGDVVTEGAPLNVSGS